MDNRVGDIEFDKNLDDPNFKICNENRVFQYYSVNTNYDGGRKAIRSEIKSFLKSLDLKENKSGYITYRFIISCEGKIGRVRYKSVDNGMQKTTFDLDFTDSLENAIKKLDNWIPGIKDQEKVDSYYQINFKVENGKIIDIF